VHKVVTRGLPVALVCVALTLLAALAWGAATGVEVSERFTPDRLVASANLALTAHFAAPPGGAPAPVRKMTVYAPAGMAIGARGAAVCSRALLEQHGPEACPADARAGFGGGVGVLQLPSETIRESYTLDFFFSSTRPGHLSLLVYASARSPVNVELIVIAREVRAPAPYGLGFSVEVPPISTIPGAPLASIESAFASLGAANVAYYKNVHGHRRLVHVRGLVVPRRCPAGGFPSRAQIEFRDGESLTLDPKVPCPAR
jgi:hypothetical protein